MPKLFTFDLHFLEADRPLTKVITPTTKESYPNVYEVTSHTESVSSIKDYYNAVVKHAKQGHCMLKGKLHRHLDKESRAGSTNTNDITPHLILDFDGLKTDLTIHQLMRKMGFGRFSYFFQFSASSGLPDKERELNCHVAMILRNGVPAPLLKRWLMHLNLTHPFLRDQARLTKNGNAISWRLDISASQNDKLIYVAPPVFKGLKDPHGIARWGWKEGKQARFEPETWPSPSLVDSQHLELFNELREAAQLPKRKKYDTTNHNNIEVLKGASKCNITGRKVERGFVYYNLEGGDSWGYYHSVDNPEVVYNFKGEPNYLLKELDPDTYRWACGVKRNEQGEEVQGTTYAVGEDVQTGKYLRMEYDHEEDLLRVYETRSLTQAIHFLKSHGQPIPDFFQLWDYTFDFNNNTLFDAETRFANRFVRSDYMHAATSNPGGEFPTISLVIEHLMGGDDETLRHFLNWLAYIVQFRKPPRTAWVLHGTQGTGKGIFFQKIMAPILGRAYVSEVNLQTLDAEYNSFMFSKLLVNVDEADITQVPTKQRKHIIGKIKTWITEEYLSFRLMYTDAFQAVNACSFIFSSNTRHAMEADFGDRRFNVAPYQDQPITPLVDSDPMFLDKIEAELQAFTDFLVAYQVDTATAERAIKNRWHEEMVRNTRFNIEIAVDALSKGDTEWLVDQLPEHSELPLDGINPLAEGYKRFVEQAIVHMRQNRGHRVHRDELRRILEYLVGQMPMSATAFTQRMNHMGLKLEKISVRGKWARGVEIWWRRSEEASDMWDSYTDTSVARIEDGRAEDKKRPRTRGSSKTRAGK